MVRGVPNTSEWKKDVSISHLESPNDVIFRCFEILWVRADDVWMKKSWTPPPLYPFELHFIDRYMLILIKNLKSDDAIIWDRL